MSRDKKLPQHVYVKWERDPNGSTSYLIADETPDRMDDGDRVGIYVYENARSEDAITSPKFARAFYEANP